MCAGRSADVSSALGSSVEASSVFSSVASSSFSVVSALSSSVFSSAAASVSASAVVSPSAAASTCPSSFSSLDSAASPLSVFFLPPFLPFCCFFSCSNYTTMLAQFIIYLCSDVYPYALLGRGELLCFFLVINVCHCVCLKQINAIRMSIT